MYFIIYLFTIYFVFVFFYWICIALFQFYSIFNFAQKTILLFFLLDELLLSPLDSINFIFVFLIKIFVNYNFSTGCRFLKQNQLFEISSNAFHSHFNLHFLLEYFVYFVFNAFLVWVCFVCVLASASASHICCYPLCSRRRSRTDERCTQTQPQMSVCAPL